MANGVTIQDMDHGWQGLLDMFADAKHAEIEVGIFAESGKHPKSRKLLIAEVAHIQEYGAPERNIPERRFLRDTYDRLGARFADQAGRVMQRVIDRQLSLSQGLQTIGAIQASAVKETINDWTTPPNAPRTIAKKGKDDPLVDSRVMRNSVKFKKYLKGREA